MNLETTCLLKADHTDKKDFELVYFFSELSAGIIEKINKPLILSYAVKKGDIKLVKFLLKLSPDLIKTYDQQKSLLTYSLVNKNDAIAEQIVKKMSIKQLKEFDKEFSLVNIVSNHEYRKTSKYLIKHLPNLLYRALKIGCLKNPTKLLKDLSNSDYKFLSKYLTPKQHDRLKKRANKQIDRLNNFKKLDQELLFLSSKDKIKLECYLIPFKKSSPDYFKKLLIWALNNDKTNLTEKILLCLSLKKIQEYYTQGMNPIDLLILYRRKDSLVDLFKQKGLKCLTKKDSNGNLSLAVNFRYISKDSLKILLQAINQSGLIIDKDLKVMMMNTLEERNKILMQSMLEEDIEIASVLSKQNARLPKQENFTLRQNTQANKTSSQPIQITAENLKEKLEQELSSLSSIDEFQLNYDLICFKKGSPDYFKKLLIWAIENNKLQIAKYSSRLVSVSDLQKIDTTQKKSPIELLIRHKRIGTLVDLFEQKGLECLTKKDSNGDLSLAVNLRYISKESLKTLFEAINQSGFRIDKDLKALIINTLHQHQETLI